MRTLILDIETRPLLCWVWTVREPTIAPNQIVDPGGVMCWAAKWAGEKQVIFRSAHHDGHDRMVEDIHRLLDQADAVVHYNGTRFDIKHLETEFLRAGLDPPSPHHDIDLLAAVRRFRFPSNKLDFVAGTLGIGAKEATGGMSLWTRCMAGDPASWAKMRRYNVRDVRLTEALYERLRPWIRRHPNVALVDGAGFGCPSCGSDRMQRRGTRAYTGGVYQLWHCQACRAWAKSAARSATTELRPA